MTDANTAQIQSLIARLKPFADATSATVIAVRNDAALGILKRFQRTGFPLDPLTKIAARPATDLPPPIALKAAGIRDRITFIAASDDTDLSIAASAALSGLAARSPVKTGFYRNSFELILNGKRASSIPKGIGGRSIVRIFNAAIYASPLEAVRAGGIFAATAAELRATFPDLRISFYYAAPRGLYSQTRPTGYVNKRSAAMAVPVIAIGGPRSRLKVKTARPGVNARRRTRAAKAISRLSRAGAIRGIN